MREYASFSIKGSYMGAKRFYNQVPFEQCERLSEW